MSVEQVDDLYGSAKPVARRVLTVFFVIDTSLSMEGKKIGAVNQAIEEVLPEIKEISAKNADAEVKIATLAFSNGCEWINEPISAEEFQWTYLNAGGCTDFGEACEELANKLSRNKFMAQASGSFQPIIFLMSDGDPTDNYEKGLAILKRNTWFQNSLKVAIAIGDDANQDVLREFTGSKELVITTHSPEALSSWIRFTAVDSIKIGSKSNPTADEEGGKIRSKTDQLLESIEKEKAKVADAGADSDYDDWD